MDEDEGEREWGRGTRTTSNGKPIVLLVITLLRTESLGPCEILILEESKHKPRVPPGLAYPFQTCVRKPV